MEETGIEGGSEEVERIKRTGTEKEDKRVEGGEGEDKRKRKSGEVHDATSKRSLDENWTGED